MFPYTEAKKQRRIAVDSVPRGPGAQHKLDGSTATVFYKAFRKATPTQIKKAEYAVKGLKIDRHRYTGRLIDVFRAKDGSLCMLLGGVLERDRETSVNNKCNFRCFNIDRGDIKSVYVEEFPAPAVQRAVIKAQKKQALKQKQGKKKKGGVI